MWMESLMRWAILSGVGGGAFGLEAEIRVADTTEMGLTLWWWWALIGFAVGVFGFFVSWIVSPLITCWWMKMTPPHPSELKFVDPTVPSGHRPFPALSTHQPSVTLSVIIPAYNEQDRLPGMLDEAMDYLMKRQEREKGFTFEVIIVDDGSADATSTVALKYTNKFTPEKVRLLKLFSNHGKGGAVCKGMLRARGEYLLMADADGATKFADIERLERSMKRIQADSKNVNGGNASFDGIVVGSRAHLVEENLAQRSPLRKFLQHGFHFIVEILCVRGINDTQCGFKLFTRSAAQKVFPSQHIQRWAFDCELLYIASQLGIPIKEEAVNWTEIEGSKINVATATFQMLRDLFLIRICYVTGIWKIAPQ